MTYSMYFKKIWGEKTQQQKKYLLFFVIILQKEQTLETEY